MSFKSLEIKENTISVGVKIIDYENCLNSLEYTLYEFYNKDNNDSIGFGGIYIINKKKNVEDILKYAEENSEDLMLLIEDIEDLNQSILFIEKVYIKRNYRKLGIGQAFLKTYLEELALQKKIERCYLYVNPFDSLEKDYEDTNNNITKLINYYNKIGFTEESKECDNKLMFKKYKYDKVS